MENYDYQDYFQAGDHINVNQLQFQQMHQKEYKKAEILSSDSESENYDIEKYMVIMNQNEKMENQK